MDIKDIEEMLGYTRFLPLPKHIIITNEPVTMKVDGEIKFRGLQPKFRKDTIILTPDKNSEAVFHEIIHTFGFGENIAYPLGKILDRINQIKQKISPFKHEVKYQKCNYCKEFETLHTKYQGRAEHYVLKEKA